LFSVEVIVKVMAGNGPEGKLRTEPFPERSRLGHLRPVEVDLTASKNVQVHLCNEGPQFDDLGVVKSVNRETIDVAEAQAHMPVSFGSGKRVPKGGFQWEPRWGKDNS